MNYILKNGIAFIDGKFTRTDILVSDGFVASVSTPLFSSDAVVIDLSDKFIFPGFVDVHVHLRQPGFIYKETIKSGTMAAAHGGYTTVCSMPNLLPAPDTLDNLLVQCNAIDSDAVIEVLPFGTITKEQKGELLSDMSEMADRVCGFSDDGRGVQDKALMRLAMIEAKRLDKVISAHCEVNSLLNGGYVHDGTYARLHGHRGISSESEWRMIERDIALAEEIGVKYHVCHISTKESVALIRDAKRRGVDITCETGPHYLLLDETFLKEDARYKMNPPLRSPEDRLALIEGLVDGTIDMIATDHAPHSDEEKAKGLEKSAMGIVGIETAFPLMYEYFVKKNIISLEKLLELISLNPRRRFGIKGGLTVGERADLTVFDLNEEYKINPEEFLSKGRSTPFENYSVSGKPILTISGGKIAWQKK